MSRRQFSQQAGSQRILSRIRVLRESPLKEIGEKLLDVFNELQAADSRGELNNFADLARTFGKIVDLLPSTYGGRFYFDAAIIQGSVEALSNERVTLNPMIVPLHSNKWGHQSLPMPSHSKTEINMI